MKNKQRYLEILAKIIREIPVGEGRSEERFRAELIEQVLESERLIYTTNSPGAVFETKPSEITILSSFTIYLHFCRSTLHLRVK